MERTQSLTPSLSAVCAALGFLAACGGGGDVPCNPAGFTNCEGNTLQTCTESPGGKSALLVDFDCTDEGKVCGGLVDSSCRVPEVGETCHARNSRSCTADKAVVRCVWVSEQPDPQASGDIGVWRSQQTCAAECQVKGSQAACAG